MLNLNLACVFPVSGQGEHNEFVLEVKKQKRACRGPSTRKSADAGVGGGESSVKICVKGDGRRNAFNYGRLSTCIYRFKQKRTVNRVSQEDCQS